MTVGYVAGVNMVLSSIGGIILWIEIKKYFGMANTWALVGAIASLVLGAFVIGNSSLQVALDMTIIYLIAAWVVVIGLVSIILSFKIRNLRYQTGAVYLGRRWWLMTVTGILLVVCGIYSLIDPNSLINMLGVYLGLSIIVAGANMVSAVA